QAQFTWTGSGTNANWSTPENWSPISVPPRDGTAQLTFRPGRLHGSDTDFASVVDQPWPMRSLSLSASFVHGSISGSGLAFGAATASAITTDGTGGSVSIGNPLSFFASRTIDCGVERMECFGNISLGSGVVLKLSGGGSVLTISGSIAGLGSISAIESEV